MSVTGKKKPRNDHLWARHPDDWYVEEPWVSRRLFEIMPLFGNSPPGRKITVLDPACGFGRIVASANTAGYEAIGSDIVQRAPGIPGFQVRDFLDQQQPVEPVDWIASNPPFKHCRMRFKKDPPPPFVLRALEVAREGVALLLPLPWIAGDTRRKWLETAGLYRVLVVTPRPSMPPGPVIEAGEEPGGGEEDFAWFIFRKGHTGPWLGGWCNWAPNLVHLVPDEEHHIATAVASLGG
jgi:hypothetical protein